MLVCTFYISLCSAKAGFEIASSTSKAAFTRYRPTTYATVAIPLRASFCYKRALSANISSENFKKMFSSIRLIGPQVRMANLQ